MHASATTASVTMFDHLCIPGPRKTMTRYLTAGAKSVTLFDHRNTLGQRQQNVITLDHLCLFMLLILTTYYDFRPPVQKGHPYETTGV